MNMQALMKQAQKMQADLMKEKEAINQKEFEGKSSSVSVRVNGKKEILEVKIDRSLELDKDDFEMLEDMIMIAINDAMKQVDEETESSMGKFGPGLSSMM